VVNSIVLMTALVPTKGHKYLIDFASTFTMFGSGKTHVIVGTLNREPIAGYLRVDAIKKAYENDSNVVIHHLSRDVPQEPSEHPDFWNVWKDIVNEFVEVGPEDFFVSSELYGIDMANVLNCKFMPCNRYREVMPIKGTDVRKNLLKNFEFILPEFQQQIRQTVTIFGAESCGKTTMTRRLAKDMNGWFIPEWAREYLETVGPEVTNEKMNIIFQGQYATQMAAEISLFDKPWVFQDTDLLSTIGYYKIFGGDYDESFPRLAKSLRSDLYVVMNDGIPFEEDPLRYGDGVRESKTQFWVDLLEEYQCKYIVVPLGTHEQQTAWVERELLKHFEEETAYIKDYTR
jgi:HTH-type transcriptional regulator, transcriptional repressor of NAD biosynthesis genes